jgi:hypothetical protein
MSGKPLSVAAALQEGLPKVPATKGIITKNRFEIFSKDRDRSASEARSRYDSPHKRQREESPVQDRNAAFTSMAGEEEKLARAKTIVTRLKTKIDQAKEQKMSGLLWDIVYDMAELMEINTGVQETTANVVVDSYNKVSSPRKSRKDRSVAQKETEPPEDEETRAKAAKMKKFAQEVREAERSSLIFKTNMGPVSIMNPDTMKRNFTLDLVAKAATVEKMPAGKPSKEVASQLDDALEMVTKMNFFGKETKKAKKKGNTGEEEDFCTIPVRLFFKDRDTRNSADSKLRLLCGTSGTIPYHRTLRTVINRTIEEAKASFPNSYIQVKVDVENFRLKVSRRTGGVWHNNMETVDLPDSVMDLSRFGPGGSRPNNNVEMEVEGAEVQG